ncbi:MAG: hypothetical protein HYX91_03695 [Chloroflexi bacterium]|nr:hypothetical protein [Chloroflexota bacterium]
MFSLLMAAMLVVALPLAVFAQEEEEFKPSIELAPTYPKLEGIAGESFEFEVEFKYVAEKAAGFNLKTTAPQRWTVAITPTFEKEKKLSAIRLEPGFGFSNKVRVAASAPFWPLPEPGEYKITVEATSGDIKGSVDLIAVVTNRYNLFVVPAIEQRFNTNATAGRDNVYAVKVQNLGTGAVENINFTTTKPEGWTVEFNPDRIETLEPIDELSVDITIKPPPETIAGDYIVGVRASGKQVTADEIRIRVTVESPTIWGWVGVAIILLVVAGLIAIFVRFSRR